jgi:hypothetical protein
MSTGPSLRVLLFHPDRPASRTTIDWIVDRQRYTRVIVPPSLQDGLAPRPGGLREPFTLPDKEEARRSAELSALAAGDEPPARATAEAMALALLAGGAILATDTGMFRDLIPLSSWSMNLKERPTDGLLVQHLGIAGRLPIAWDEAAEQALEAVTSGDPGRVRRIARARRLRARREGPEMFRRLARTNDGLRPGVVYLDLLAASRADSPAFREFLLALDRRHSLSLLRSVAAVFI